MVDLAFCIILLYTAILSIFFLSSLLCVPPSRAFRAMGSSEWKDEPTCSGVNRGNNDHC